MSDNITAPATGAVLATDDIGGIHHPLVKVEFGAADSATPVSSANPLPVAIISGGGGGGGGDASAANQTAVQAVAGSDATKAVAVQFITGGKAFPITAAALPLPTGAATETTLAAVSSKLPAALGAQASGSSLSIVPGTGATFAVTGTFWQATQPVSVTSLPLPSGAATETTLSGLSGKLPAALGAQAVGSSFSIVPATGSTFALAATETYVGKFGGDVLEASAAPTVSTSAYTSGDVIGSKMTFANLARTSGGAGIISMVRIACKSAQTGNVDLLIFGADPAASTFTDNAALDVNAADYDKLIGVLHITDWTNLGTPSFAEAVADMSFKLASGSTLYAVLVARSTPTLASTSDLKVTLSTLPG